MGQHQMLWYHLVRHWTSLIVGHNDLSKTMLVKQLCTDNKMSDLFKNIPLTITEPKPAQHNKKDNRNWLILEETGMSVR